MNRLWSTIVAVCLLVAHASTGLALDKAGPQTDAAKWGRLSTTSKTAVKATALAPATKNVVASSQKKSLLSALWSKLLGR